MKKSFEYLLWAVVVLYPGSITAPAAMGQERNLNELARKIVTTSAHVQPGEVVVVNGGKHTMPLMEALAIEARKAGGMVTLFVESDRLTRALYADVPEQYMEQKPTYLSEWLKHVDVWITTTHVDTGNFSTGVSEERAAKAAKAWDVWADTLLASKARLIFIHSYPQKDVAGMFQLDLRSYEQLYFESLNIDYRQVAERAARLRTSLKAGQLVKVTSPEGTNFTFSVGDRPIYLTDGVANEEKAKATTFAFRIAHLPIGQVFFAPIETSVNGKVVATRIPIRAAPAECRSQPLQGLSFEIKNGRVENFKAEKGVECFERIMAASTGPRDMFGYFQIGLNPALSVQDAEDYGALDAAGVISIGFGNNQHLGGDNKTEGGFGFTLVKATVVVNGKAVVKDGTLKETP